MRQIAAPCFGAQFAGEEDAVPVYISAQMSTATHNL